MRYLHCFAVVTSFVVQNNNQLENSLTETLTTMVSLSLQNLKFKFALEQRTYSVFTGPLQNSYVKSICKLDEPVR